MIQSQLRWRQAQEIVMTYGKGIVEHLILITRIDNLTRRTLQLSRCSLQERFDVRLRKVAVSIVVSWMSRIHTSKLVNINTSIGLSILVSSGSRTAKCLTSNRFIDLVNQRTKTRDLLYNKPRPPVSAKIINLPKVLTNRLRNLLHN